MSTSDPSVPAELHSLTNFAEEQNEPESSSSAQPSLPSVRFGVDGLHCASCVNRVELALKSLPEIKTAEVNLATHEARVSYQNTKPEIQVLKETLSKAGYSYRDLEESHLDENSPLKATENAFWYRLLVGVPLAALIGIISMTGMEFAGKDWLLLVLSVPVVFYSGWPFFSGAFQSLKHGIIEMNTLIAVGAGVAFLSSLTGLLTRTFWPNHPPIHFDAAAMIIMFVLIGRYLEEKAKRRTTHAVESLLELQPPVARVFRNDEFQEVSPEDVTKGELLQVLPGERIPLDGYLLEGSSTVDESMMTGESVPVLKEAGSFVMAGTVNGAGAFRFRVEHVGKETLLQQIIQQVREAQGTKAPIARLADIVSAWFVPIVVGIAIVSFLVWWLLIPSDNPFERGMLSLINVLIVACPCALGLATPTAIMVAMGRAAQLGVLFRNGEVVESAHQLDTLFLDKTGTITEGKFSVSNILPQRGISEDDLLQIGASVDARSEHPLAKGIITAATERSLAMFPLEDFHVQEGRGVSGVIDGHRILVGSFKYMQEKHVLVIAETSNVTVSEEQHFGTTSVFIAREEQPDSWELLGEIQLSDQPRSSIAEGLESLNQKELRVIMLSGDSDSTAKQIAHQVGITEVIAEVLPSEKTEQVKLSQQEGYRVGMVGDGINDAPALTQSDVGFAVSSGTDIAMQSADVTLLGAPLQGVITAIELSEKTLSIIKQNLVFAFFYNSLGIPLAAGLFYPIFGMMLPPMFAAAAMALSSVSVVLNSLRLQRFVPSV